MNSSVAAIFAAGLIAIFVFASCSGSPEEVEPTVTVSPTSLPTAAPTETPSPSPTPAPPPTPTPIPTPTATPVPTATATPTPTPTPVPTATPTPTATPKPPPPRKVIVLQGIDSSASWPVDSVSISESLLSRVKNIYLAVDKFEGDSSSTSDRQPLIKEQDFLSFSYSGEYFDISSGTMVDVSAHSGTSLQYASYSRADTCSGVVEGAANLSRLVDRLIELEPEVQIDIVAHSMGGLISTYLLSTSTPEIRSHIRTVTTLDSPLQGFILQAPFSACDYEDSPAWQDLALGSAVARTIATIGGTPLSEKVGSIISAIGSAIPGEAALSTSCGAGNPIFGHSCVWSDDLALATIADAIINGPPSVPRLRWLNESGVEIQQLQRDELVQLYAPVRGLADGIIDANIFEVDLLSEDDYLGTIRMTAKDGVATVWWRAVWTPDGFDGDPEYKFVINNVGSPELAVH